MTNNSPGREPGVRLMFEARESLFCCRLDAARATLTGSKVEVGVMLGAGVGGMGVAVTLGLGVTVSVGLGELVGVNVGAGVDVGDGSAWVGANVAVLFGL
jgi:hypothetical protein